MVPANNTRISQSANYFSRCSKTAGINFNIWLRELQLSLLLINLAFHSAFSPHADFISAFSNKKCFESLTHFTVHTHSNQHV